MRTELFSIAVAVAVAGCGLGQSHSDASLGSDIGSRSCPPMHFPVEVFPSSADIDQEPCILVERAWKAVETALHAGELAPISFELDDVRSALVGTVTEVSSEGLPLERTWQVQFFLNGTRYDVLAIIDRRTEELTLELTHKPL
jgi:hypothetical protein